MVNDLRLIASVNLLIYTAMFSKEYSNDLGIWKVAESETGVIRSNKVIPFTKHNIRLLNMTDDVGNPCSSMNLVYILLQYPLDFPVE